MSVNLAAPREKERGETDGAERAIYTNVGDIPGVYSTPSYVWPSIIWLGVEERSTATRFKPRQPSYTANLESLTMSPSEHRLNEGSAGEEGSTTLAMRNCSVKLSGRGGIS